jgi:hypothetical protein
MSLDEFLYDHRSAFVIALLIGIATVLSSFVATFLGFAWRPDPFAPVTLSDEATSLLAVGTLALAYAALIQAVSGIRGIELRHRPHLEIACLDQKYAPPGPFQQTKYEGGELAIRNLGPGVATEVWLMWYRRPTPEEHRLPLSPPNFPIRRSEVEKGGAGLPSLDVGQNLWHFLEIPHSQDGDSEVTIEVHASDVLDNPVPLRVYQFVEILGDQPNHWRWQTRMTSAYWPHDLPPARSITYP